MERRGELLAKRKKSFREGNFLVTFREGELLVH
jgi:hypothetical protein